MREAEGLAGAAVDASATLAGAAYFDHGPSWGAGAAYFSQGPLT